MDLVAFDEFWNRDIAVRFVSYVDWLRNTSPNYQESLRLIYDAWSDCTFDEIKKAIDVVVEKNDGGVGPYDSFPSRVRSEVSNMRLPKRSKSTLFDRRYGCLTCRDTGTVMCFSVEAMMAVRTCVLRDKPIPSGLPYAAFACNCSEGDKLFDRGIVRKHAGHAKRFNDLVRYRPDLHTPIDYERPESESRNRLIEWAENFVPKRTDAF